MESPIEQIKQAEAQAGQIEVAAQQQAQYMLHQAREQAAESRKQQEQAANNAVAALMQQTQAQITAEREGILRKTQEQRKSLQAQARQNLPQAIQTITNFITRQYGRHPA